MDTAAYRNQTAVLQLSGPITMRFGDMVTEDDRGWLEAESEALLVNGALPQSLSVPIQVC